MAYRIKQEALDVNPQLFTLVNKKRVTLHGRPETVWTDATAVKPKQQITIPAATQADLKILFEQKHPFVEEFDAKEDKAEK